jgi:hypothetical protein
MLMGLAIVPMKKGKEMGICLLEEKEILENNRVASGNDFSKYRDTKLMVFARNDLGSDKIGNQKYKVLNCSSYLKYCSFRSA